MNRFVKFSLFAFVAFAFIYIFTIDISDGKDCELRNRAAGIKSYLLFPLTKELVSPAEDARTACYYEFYNGLHLGFNLFGSDNKRLESVCDFINQRTDVRLWNQCYFRIGIAAVYTKRSNISDKTKVSRLIDDKIRFCEGPANMGLSCVTGVFTGLNLALQNEYGDTKFPIPEGNPFWYCRLGESLKYKLQCMRNIDSFLFNFTNGEITEAINIILRESDNDTEKYEATLTFYSSLAFRDEFTEEKMIKTCSSILPKWQRLACIVGFANGITETVRPGTEAVSLVGFCLSDKFVFADKFECIRVGFNYVPTDNQERDCLINVPKEYRKACSLVGEPTVVPPIE